MLYVACVFSSYNVRKLYRITYIDLWETFISKITKRAKVQIIECQQIIFLSTPVTMSIINQKFCFNKVMCMYTLLHK